MKLVTFTPPDLAEQRVGVLTTDGQSVVDLQATAITRDGAASLYFTSMLEFLDGGDETRDEAERTREFAVEQQPPGVLHELSAVTLHAPVPRPRSLRDCLAFERHLLQATRTVLKWRSRSLAAVDRCMERCFGRGLVRLPKVWYEHPLYYKGNPHSVVGPETEILWPALTEKLDYELEFGIFIGREGRDIPAAEADRYIAGYTIFNDFSARDIQMREMQGRLGPAKSKDFDTGNVLGPFLVTPDEIPDPYALTMTARVNGEEWSRGSSGEMHYSFGEIIEWISQSETLVPGDFIGSGTVPGGCGLELDRWLQPGDVVELEVEGLGVLRNRVVR